MSEGDTTNPLIIIRRSRRKKGGGHHGGSWKVAYADFVTAMMAFFLVMWLLGVSTHEQRAAVSAYFNNPSMTPGAATMAPPGKLGPGGASDSAIKLGGMMDRSHGPGKDRRGRTAGEVTAQQIKDEARRQDRARLEELKMDLQAAIEKSQALAPFKDQLLIDITPEGLRIQIIDKLNRPMFDTGSAELKPYTDKILVELAKFINEVPNRITLSGHTDDAPYSTDHNYSNWELSADRANAARRALLRGGLQDTKITQVVGLAAAVPFNRADPSDPANRRISIMIMTKQAEKAALSQGPEFDSSDDAKGLVLPPGVRRAPAPSKPTAAAVSVHTSEQPSGVPAPVSP